VKGKHSNPSIPHPSLPSQKLDVQSIHESTGVMYDSAREKKANTTIYAAPSNSRSQGFVRGRVTDMRAVSSGILSVPNRVWAFMSSRGTGSVSVSFSAKVADYICGRVRTWKVYFGFWTSDICNYTEHSFMKARCFGSQAAIRRGVPTMPRRTCGFETFQFKFGARTWNNF